MCFSTFVRCDDIPVFCLEQSQRPAPRTNHCGNDASIVAAAIRVHTGQGKLEKVREFEWSGKVRENAKVTGKSGKFLGKILPICAAVVMLIIVELESNPPYC